MAKVLKKTKLEDKKVANKQKLSKKNKQEKDSNNTTNNAKNKIKTTTNVFKQNKQTMLKDKTTKKSNDAKNKKNIILIIGFVLGVILVWILIGSVLYKGDNKKTDVLDNILEEKIKQMSDVNILFKNENLSEDGKFESEEKDKTCLKYNGDVSVAKEKLNSIYETIMSYKSDIKISTSKYENGREEENLYVCIPAGCQVGEVTKYELLEESLTEDIRQVRVNHIQIIDIKKQDGKWIFESPTIICSYNEQNEK